MILKTRLFRLENYPLDIRVYLKVALKVPDRSHATSFRESSYPGDRVSVDRDTDTQVLSTQNNLNDS